MHEVELPSFLLSRLVNQLGPSFPAFTRSLKAAEENKTIPLPVFFSIFDTLDSTVGLHWPILAKSLWQPTSHPLLLAYFSTAGFFGEALTKLFAETNVYLPIFKVSMKPAQNGLLLSGQPTYQMSERHWEIFDLLYMLTFFAILAFYKLTC